MMQSLLPPFCCLFGWMDPYKNLLKLRRRSRRPPAYTDTKLMMITIATTIVIPWNIPSVLKQQLDDGDEEFVCDDGK